MSCFLEEEEGTLKAVLIFKRDQLQYDIDNLAYIEGSVMPNETEPHNKHMVQDVGQEGNIDRVTRVLDLQVTKVKELLYPYTKHDVHKQELKNLLRQPRVYGIVLSLPATFSQTTLNLMESLIHEYLVCRVLEDWMSITNPGKTEMWTAKAEKAVSELRRSLNARRGRVSRTQHPF